MEVMWTDGQTEKHEYALFGGMWHTQLEGTMGLYYAVNPTQTKKSLN
jgi:hypothetical protein